jgi:hypothetical protein
MVIPSLIINTYSIEYITKLNLLADDDAPNAGDRKRLLYVLRKPRLPRVPAKDQDPRQPAHELDTETRRIIQNAHRTDFFQDIRDDIEAWIKEVNILGKVVVRSPSLIYSKPGCSKQPAHCDCRFQYQQKAVFPVNRMSLSAIVALQDATTVDVWPYSHRVVCNWYQHRNEQELGRIGRASELSCNGTFPIQHQRVVLSKGQVLLFRQDLVHRGTEYGEMDNLRIFLYLDDTVAKREGTTPLIIAEHSSSGLSKHFDLDDN